MRVGFSLYIVFSLCISPAIAQANLDLTSTNRDGSAGQIGQHQVTIGTSSGHRTVSSGEALTDAERVAVSQVLSGGQTILLNDSGAAVGGTLNLNTIGNSLGNLVVPRGVTATYDFGSQSTLNIAGNLTNAGTLQAISTASNVSTATIMATNIWNLPGGLITSVLPQNLAGASTLNLQLIASQNIVNAGSIVSSGSLSMVAGGSIVNAANSLQSSIAPLMQAMTNLSLFSGTGAFTNSGLITANSHNIDVLSSVGHTLMFDNTGGTLQALKGVINFGEAASVAKFDTSLIGGEFLSRELSIYSGNGLASVNVDRISGAVNVAAGLAQIGVQRGDLRIDSMKLTGDPIYYNAGGNLDLSGLFSLGSTFTTLGGDFVALAGGNITAGSAPINSLIDAANAAGSGGRVVLSAGSTFTVSGGSPVNCNNCAGLYSITGSSASGGSINLPNVSFRTNSSQISMQANAGSIPGSGSLTVGNLENAGAGAIANNSNGQPGTAGSSGGSISVSAYGDIQTGFIRTYGGGGSGSSGYDGNFGNGGAGGAGGAVSVASAIGSISVLGDINSSGGGGGGGGSGRFGGNGGDAGAISLLSSGSINVSGPLLAVGGGAGSSLSGGGSFGGGGGASATAGGTAVGGGGLYGGGAASGGSSLGANGGGAFGAGLGAGSAESGDAGYGGASAGLAGSAFGVSSQYGGHAASQGNYNPGTAGVSGDVTLQGSSITVAGTTASQYSTLSTKTPNPFSSSPFSALTIAGRNITVNASAGSFSSGGILAIGDAGQLSITEGGVAAATVNSLGYIGASGIGTFSSSVSGQSLTVNNIYLFENGGTVSLSSKGALNVGNVNVWLGPSFARATGMKLAASGDITISGDILSPGAAIDISTTGGTITSAGITVAGLGGAHGSNGRNGGSITMNAAGDIQTAYLRTFGGGGGGADGYAGLGAVGNGGAGGAVSVVSTGGAITILGDINASGGGGGGAGYPKPGGAGGAAAAVSLSSPGSINITGPVLSVGGGGGGMYDGGGALGGGGGASGVDAPFTPQGGGGFFGGGATAYYVRTGADGGGARGGGAGFSTGEAGTAGYGGSDTSGYGASSRYGGWAGAPGCCATPGLAGSSGDVSIQGSSINISGTVGSAYAALSSATPNPFTISPFASLSVAGRSVTIEASAAAMPIVAGTIAIGDGGSLTVSAAGVLQNTFNAIAYIGSAGGNASLAYGVAGGTLSINTLYLFESGGTLSVSSNGKVDIGSVVAFTSSSPRSGSSLSVNAATDIHIASQIVAPSSAVSLTASGGDIVVGNVDVAGAGGEHGTSGRDGGKIVLNASGNIQTGFLHAFGGGGGGADGYYGGNNNPGNGGKGGDISVATSSGTIAVTGDINSSGGGGGGGGGNAGISGSGGAAGAINVIAPLSVSISGPVLAAGGGAGSSSGDGGGSFGGGGGAAGRDDKVGVGGGGYYGGGAVTLYGRTGSTGGGGTAGGAAFGGAQSGEAGYGGSDLSTYGSMFGTSNGSGGWVASIAQSGTGSAGTSGDVTLKGQTVTITGTVGASFASLTSRTPNPFANSPYASISVAGKTVTLDASAPGGVSPGGTIAVGDGGTVSVTSAGVQRDTYAGLAYIGRAGGIAQLAYTVSGGTLSIGSLYLFQNGGEFRITSAGDVAITAINSNISTRAISGSSLKIVADDNITIGSDVLAPASTVNLNSLTGSVTTGNISVSGLGGPSGTAGGSAGGIQISAAGQVQTGYLRAFGGGGGGASGYYGGNHNAGQGGDGGAISVQSTGGAVSINGDVNTSGGGGGGAGSGDPGGKGGAAGKITISAAQALSIAGPVLAAGGAGGSGNQDGGGSFGGGGGGSGNDGFAARGGGGLFGGGGVELYARVGGAGGGALGGGAPGGNAQAGSAGYGGGALGVNASLFGRGINGASIGDVLQTGQGAFGADADVSLSGGTVTISGTVSSQYGPLSPSSPNPFSTSPYQQISLVGKNISITSSKAAGAGVTAGAVYFAQTGTLSINSAGGVSVAAVTATTNAVGSTVDIFGSLGISVPGAIQLQAGTKLTLGQPVPLPSLVNLNSDAGAILTGAIDVSGIAGTIDVPGGSSSGSIQIQANGNIVTGKLLAFGGDGFKASRGGGGGIIHVDSTAGSVTVNGDIDAHAGAGGIGTNAGTITITASAGASVSGNIDTHTEGGLSGHVKISTAAGLLQVGGTIDTHSSGKRMSVLDLLNFRAGDVTLSAPSVTLGGDLNLYGRNTAFGGDLKITLSGGSLNVMRKIDTSSKEDNGGNILVTGPSTGTVSFNSAGNSSETAIVTSSSHNRGFSGTVRVVTPGADLAVTGGITTASPAGAQAGEIVMTGKTISVNGTLLSSSNSAGGGAIDLSAAGNLTIMNVDASGAAGSGTGSGGVVMLAAGTSGVGDLVTGSILTNAGGSGFAAGSLTALAASSIITGNITAVGTNAAVGGLVSLVAGNQNTSGNLTYGTINTSGASGGTVALISLGTTGVISNPSDIITTGTGVNAVAGSVTASSTGIISLGNITANATNASSTTAYGGSIFLSSAAAGTAISTGSINTSAPLNGNKNAAGNVFLIVNSGSTAVAPTITQSADVAGYTFNGTPSGAVTDINGVPGTLTLSFSSAAVSGYNPGGFITANAPGATVIVDTNGDSRLFVPLAVLRGDVTLKQLQSAVNGGKASPLSVYATGNITISDAVIAGSTVGPAPPVSFQSNQGDVTLSTINVSGDTRGGSIVISSPKSFSLANGQSLIADSNTGAGGRILITVPNGKIDLGTAGNASGNVISATGVSGGIIQLEAQDNISNYGVGIIARGTTGDGGLVRVASYQGSVSFRNYHDAGTDYNADIDVSSGSGAGGSISVYANNGVSVLADPTSCCAVNTSAKFTANGGSSGGSVNIQSPEGHIDLTDLRAVSATGDALTGQGGSILLYTTLGNITSAQLDTSAGTGGDILASGMNFVLPSSSSIMAEGKNGNGGNITIYTAGTKVINPGVVQLGAVNNQTRNLITANGTAAGGSINIFAGGDLTSNQVSMTATGGTGSGGKILAVSYQGGISLRQEYFNSAGVDYNFKADIDASSAGGSGGSIELSASADIASSRDASVCCGSVNNSVIRANGDTAGGAILLHTETGNILLQETSSISAVGGNASGGSIVLEANGATLPAGKIVVGNMDASGASGGSIQSTSHSIDLLAGNNWQAVGIAGDGGTINVTADGYVVLSGAGNQSNNHLSVSGANAGGSITIAAGKATATSGFTSYETSLLATGASGSGGKVSVTANQSNLTLYNEYFNSGTSQNFNADVDVSSASGNGGSIALRTVGSGTVSSVRDATLSGGNTTTHRIIATSGAGGTGGTILVDAAGVAGYAIDFSDTLLIDSSAGTGGKLGTVTLNASAGGILVPAVQSTLDNGGLVSINGAGAVTTTAGSISADNVLIQNSGYYDIALGGTVTGTTSAVIRATSGGNIGISDDAAIVRGALVELDTGGSVGSSAKYFRTNAVTARFHGGNAVFVDQTGALNLDTSSSLGSFVVRADDQITVVGTVTGAINLSTATGSNSDIIVNAPLNGSWVLSLSADGSGKIVQNNGVTFAGDNVRLSSGSGDIGASAQKILTAGRGNLAVNTGGSGSAYIQQSGPVQLEASSAGTVFDFTTDSNFTLSNALVAPQTFIRTTTASNGNIVFNTNPSATSLTVSAGGTGSISQAPSVSFNSSSVVLASDTGNIGSSGNFIRTTSGSLSANTSGSGNVYVNQSGNVTLGASKAGGTFWINTAGNLSIGGDVSGGNVVLQTGALSSGNISINGQVVANALLTVTTDGAGMITVQPGSSAVSTTGSASFSTVSLFNRGLISGAGNVAIQSNVSGGNLSLDLSAGSTISATSAKSSLSFSAGAISTTSGNGSIAAGDRVTLTGTGGTNAINFSAGSISGLVSATGSSVAVNTATGDLSTDTITGTDVVSLNANSGSVLLGGVTSGASSITVAAKNDAVVNAKIAAVTTLDITAGRSIVVGSGTNASGAGVGLTTTLLQINGSVTSTGALSLQGNGAGNALTVDLGAAAILSTSGAGSDLTINSAKNGSITINKGGGTISSTNNVSFNGGGQPVSVSVDSIAGRVSASGSSVVLITAKSDLEIVAASTSGNATVRANGGDLLVNGAITAAGSLDLGSGVTGKMSVAGGVTLSGGSVSISSPQLDIDGSIIANGGDVSVQSNGANSALALNFSNGSSITASSGASNINFNTAPGAISALSGFGSLSAKGAVRFNGGTNAVDIRVSSIAGTVEASGNPVSIATSVGNLATGVLNSGGALSLSSVGALTMGVGGSTASGSSVTANAKGDINLDGKLNAASSITLTSGSKITFNESITAGGALTIDASGSATVGAAVTISGSSADVNTGRLDNNGTIFATGVSGTVQVRSAGGLTVQGDGTVSGLGGVTLTAKGANTLDLTGNQTLDAKGIGTISLLAADPGAAINFAGGSTTKIAAGSRLSVSSPQLNFGASSAITATGASAISFASPAGTPLSVTSSGGSSAQVGSANGGSITFTPANGVVSFASTGGGAATLNLDSATVVNTNHGQVNVGAGMTVSGSGSITVNAATVSNDGVIGAASNLTIQDNGNLLLTGPGQISSASLTLLSTVGSVTAMQSKLSTIISGNAGQSFQASATTGDVTANQVRADNADINLTASSGNVIVVAGGNLNSATDVTLSGDSGVSVSSAGAPATSLTAGRVSANPFSMLLTDYDMTAITTTGGVRLTSRTGSVTVGDNTHITSAGKSIGISASGDIRLGSGNVLFAQGGNIWLNGNANMSGGSNNQLIAIARVLPGNAPLTIAGQSVTDYSGGSISIDVSSVTPNYDQYLRDNFELNRTVSGTDTRTGTVDMTGSVTSMQDQGSIVLKATGIASITATNSNFIARGGVIFVDPPASTVGFTGFTLLAVAPRLLPPVPLPIAAAIVATPAPIPLITAPAATAAPTVATPPLPAGGVITPLDTISEAGTVAAAPSVDQEDVVIEPVANNFIMSQQCQPFVMHDDRDMVMIGESGTIFRQDPLEDGSKDKPTSMSLQNGRLIIMSGKNNITITTRSGNINIPPRSVSVVSQNGGVLRTASLAGAPSIVSSLGSRSDSFAIAPGQEVVLADESVPDEELIPIDGLSRDLIVSGAVIHSGGQKYRKNSIKIQEMLVKDRLFRCHSQEIFRRVKKEAPETSSLPQPLQPIAFMQSLWRSASGVSTARSGNSIAKFSSTSDFQFHSPWLCSLRSGEVLVHSDRDVDVRAGRSVVRVRSGAIALIRSDGQVVRVHNLHAPSFASVQIRSIPLDQSQRLHTVNVGCGEEAVFTQAGESALKEAIKNDHIARRRATLATISKAVTVMTAETSVVSQAAESNLLCAIMHSSQPEERKLADQIKKTAACLMIVTFKHGQYQSNRQD